MRPRRHSACVVRAMTQTFAALGQERPGLTLHCENRIPHGRGLGSSAAATVAGILLARQLADDGPRRLDDRAVLALASSLEGHPDNAAAALRGGLTVAWQDEADRRRACAVRLEPATSLVVVVLVPATTLATEQARGLLPETVPHRDAAHAAGRAALLVHALTHDPGLLLPATEDRLHQAYRAAAMPRTAELVARLRAEGFAAVVSGAGPSVLVLGRGELDEGVLAGRAGSGWTVRALGIDRDGARVSGTGVSRGSSVDPPNG
jgi:homoserine kinase